MSNKTEEIIKYETKQRVLNKINNVTSAVAEFGRRIEYDNDATDILVALYKMTMGYICDAIIEIDEIDNTKTTKRKVK